MRLAILFFFIVISLSSYGQNQNQIDSLLLIHDKTEDKKERINILNNIGRLYGSGSLDKARFYNNEAIRLSKEIDYPRGIAYGYLFLSASIKRTGNNQEAINNLKNGINDLEKYDFPKGSIELNTWIASNYITMRKLDSAKIYLNNSIIRAKKIDYYMGLITTYLEYGGIFQSQDNLKKSLEYYIKVDSICTARNVVNDPDCAIAISNIGLIKGRFKEYDEAEKYYKLALEYFNRLKTQKRAAINTINSLGTIELARNNFTEAEEYYQEALDYYIASKNKVQIGYMYSQFANLYGKQKRFSDAENAALKSLKISRELNDSLRLIYGLNVLGRIKADLLDFEKSISLAQESLEIAKKLEKPSMVLKAMDLLKRVSYKGQKYKLTAEVAIRYSNYKDSIDNIQNKKELFEIEAKYQTEKKEQEIALLKSEKELNEQKRKSQRNLFIGGIGLTSLAGLFLFFLFKNRQTTNKKLRQLDKAKSNFFANISHEFRTPLTLISNPIESALENESLPQKEKEQFKMAKRNSDRLLSLVNQLLELSKIDAGQLKLKISKGHITGLINTLVEPFVYQANQKEIEFSTDIQEPNEETYFDKDAVEKIIVNLLSNALKYTPNQGEIGCNASIQNNQLHFSIKNTGNGLTKDQRDNIFERFYQTSEDHTGSGIGLALVKELVDLYGGSITVESEPEQWTQFMVTLPVDKASFKNHQFIEDSDVKANVSPIYDEADIEETEFTTNNNQPILLIVEDNKDVQILLKQNFEDHYNILLADNGQIGLDLALEHIPDIIISDIMMPIMDGIEFTKTIKTDERTSHIPVILLTAKAGDENELLGIETGADDYITKPFNSKLLSTKVSNLLELRQKLQVRYSQELVLLPKDISINSADEQFLNKVQAVLDEKLIESSFSIEDFSKAVGMSRMQLHRKLKAKTGLSAAAFIRSQRLKLAAELLKKSDCNISEVGYAVGFNDPSYFAKRFKEMYNCTPTEFANKHS